MGEFYTFYVRVLLYSVGNEEPGMSDSSVTSCKFKWEQRVVHLGEFKLMRVCALFTRGGSSVVLLSVNVLLADQGHGQFSSSAEDRFPTNSSETVGVLLHNPNWVKLMGYYASIPRPRRRDCSFTRFAAVYYRQFQALWRAAVNWRELHSTRLRGSLREN